MSAGMCEHIRVYTNRDAYLFERACRERDIELLSRTWSQTHDVPIARGNSDRRVSILSTRFVRSSFPSGIRRSRSRIQKTRGRTEKKKKKEKKKIKTWNTERRRGWIRVDSRYKIRLWNTHGYFAVYTLKIRSYRVANVATVIAG